MLGIVVDPPARNKALAERLKLPFALLSDPKRETVGRYGLIDPKHRRNIALAATILVDRGGKVAWVYREENYRIRPPAEAVLAELAKLAKAGAKP